MIEFLLVLVSVIESLLLTTVSDYNVIKYVREVTTFSCNLYIFVSSISLEISVAESLHTECPPG